MQTDSRHPVLPERRVRCRCARQGLGARPRLHLRRRRLRGGAGLRPASCSASTSTWRGSAAASAKLRIANPHSRDAVARALPAARRGAGRARRRADQLVYIQVTRGVALRDHVMPADIEPTVFMMASADEAADRPSSATRAWPASRARDFRWERGDIKSISLLGNVLARQMSADHGAVETIMFRDGFLTEASAQQRLGRARRRAARAAEERARARGHPLRADPRAVRGVRHRLQPAPDPRGRRAAPPTSCCSARRPRRCCR